MQILKKLLLVFLAVVFFLVSHHQAQAFIHNSVVGIKNQVIDDYTQPKGELSEELHWLKVSLKDQFEILNANLFHSNQSGNISDLKILAVGSKSQDYKYDSGLGLGVNRIRPLTSRGPPEFQVVFGYRYDLGEGCVVPKKVGGDSPIGFAPGTGGSTVERLNRLDHGTRHLFEQGVLPGNPGSKASRALAKTEVSNLLENPLKTFDHVMKQGGLRVKGFFGKINGKDVVVFVSKEAKGKKILQGELVTGFTPTAQQRINFGLNQ